MAFRVGQKVVFIGGKTGHEWNNLPKSGLKIGTVYTVREIDQRYVDPFGYVGIRVEEELYEPVVWCGQMVEPAHAGVKFRPAIERKTDISIFTEMLTPQRREIVY